VYGKIFGTIYSGTLYGQWQAIVTFQQMIVLCDSDGMIDMTPPAIAATTSIPLDIIEKGIEILLQPDKYSRSPAEEGRRIVLIDPSRPWGWKIVNHEFYKNLASRDDKKKADRDRIAAKRSAAKTIENKDVAGSRAASPEVANVAHTDTDTDTEREAALLALDDGKNKTIDTFLALCKKAGVRAIPDNHAAWKYAEKIKLEPAMVKAAWYRFKNKYRGTKKKYIDWRLTFVNVLRDNWYDIWGIDANKQVYWKSAGHQARAAMEADAEGDL
jgi:hypothetical protein